MDIEKAKSNLIYHINYLINNYNAIKKQKSCKELLFKALEC